MNKTKMKTFTNILNEELVAAAGCTEPIAIALVAAKCRSLLGSVPSNIQIFVSGNVLKNVKGVVIPGTSSLRGVIPATALGIISNQPQKELEVLHGLTSTMLKEAENLIRTTIFDVIHEKDKPKLYIRMKMWTEQDEAIVELMHLHTNITYMSRNEKVLLLNPCDEQDFNSPVSNRKDLSVHNIIEYANQVPIEDIEPILRLQSETNLDIAEWGLKHPFGLNVGQVLLSNSSSLQERMKAYASAGSDARMSGCTLPVIINSGSGNQGMVISSSISILAKHLKKSKNDMYRALAIANLIPIHIKTTIGRLSAFCGAVTAAAGVGAAITYLQGGTESQINMTIQNIFANITGIVCDGAKPSCALKIATSVDAAYMAAQLALRGSSVEGDTGIITTSVEKTIKDVGLIAREAMTETDRTIIELMTNQH
jgi:L-cysteine desulfidase